MSINEAVRSLGRLYCFSYLVSLIASSLVSCPIDKNGNWIT